MPHPSIHTDVLIAGSGPAGSAAAIALARSGRTVTLVERDHHPRFHIGESLLPMSMPLLRELGVLEEVKSFGVLKKGADFPTAGGEGYHVFRFSQSLRPTWPNAFQVRRDQFDECLARAAEKAGAQVIDRCTIKTVRMHDRGVEAAGATANGPVTISARYLIDATGRDCLIGRLLQLRERHTAHRSAAIYAHFLNVAARPAEDAGNISIYRAPRGGWVWVIPLPDGITSVGYVCGPEALRVRSTDNQQLLIDVLKSIKGLNTRMGQYEVAGNFSVTGNYSYRMKKITGKRWLAVGDAAGFIDPIFSTGVHLALHSGLKGAKLVNSAIDNPRAEARLQRKFTRTHARGLTRASWFIFRFNTSVMKHLFANPKDTLGIKRAIISVLAGDLHRDNGIVWRLAAFKAIYFGHWAAAKLGLWSPKDRVDDDDTATDRTRDRTAG